MATGPDFPLHPMRRRLPILCLLAAWLCAHGAVWHVVQVVAWTKMFHAYAQVMPVHHALARTFDGSDVCGLCEVAQGAQDETREKLPASAAAAASLEKFVTSATLHVPPIALPEAATPWPELVAEIGLTRGHRVPVPPPRA